MDRILSEQFVSTFLIPYIKGKILGNVEKDPILQKVFATYEPLKDEERNALKINYFKDTGTIFEKDFNLREVFWTQFVEFIHRQKKICADNVRLLALRTLPDPVTHEFSNEAQQNLLKFAYQAANAIQDYKIAQQIKNKESNNEISKEKAQDLKGKLKDSRLVMVKDKNGRDKILEDEEIKRALANVAYQADFYSGLQISGEGESLVVYPDEIPSPPIKGQPKFEEKGMTLSNLELEIYEKQATKIEIMLEDSGLYVEGKLKPDKTGMVRGYVVDKKTRQRLLIEVNTDKPNSKFRFTFVSKPGKSFMADKKEIQKYFKEENKSADEVNDIKEKEGMERQEMFPSKAPEELKKKPEPQKEAAKTGLEAVGPVPAREVMIRGFGGKAAGAGGVPAGIIAAKEEYFRKTLGKYRQGITAPMTVSQQTRAEQQYQPPGQPKETSERTMGAPLPAAVPPPTPKKGINPAKITGIAAAAGIGWPMLFTLFS